MDKYYKSFSSFLISNNFIGKDDGELYEYAAEVVLHAVINSAVTLVIGFLLKMPVECLAVFLTFFMLRKFSGGLHAEKYSVCLLSSSVLMAVALLAVKFLKNSSFAVPFIAASAVSVLFIAFFSPVENKNKKLTRREKKIYRIISIVIALAALSLTICLLLLQKQIGYSIGVGVILTSAMVICGKLKGKLSRA